MDPRGKVVVITGASMGIGEALARAFVHEDCKVVLSARDLGRLEAARARVGSPERTSAIACDVRNREEIDRLLGLTLHNFGRVDIWINNAGFRPAGFGCRHGHAGLPRHVRHQPVRRHRVHASGDPGDEAPGRRHDHQHLQRCRPHSAAVLGRLLRHQVRHERHRQGRADGTARKRRARDDRVSRLHHH